MFKKYLSIIILLIVSTATSYSDVDLDSLKKQASDGDVTAQFRLGELHKKGKEVSQDYTLAAIWYRKAAEAGNAEAQYSLAEMYSEGKGVPQDWEMSEKWYKQSAEQGNVKAQYAYAFVYYHYDHESILNWFGDHYKNHNYKKAIAWFEKAAKQDHPNALYFLGRMYEEGEGVEYNIEKAAQYFLKAANLGHSSSQHSIGKMHQDGEGNMEWDYEKAVFWLKKAALNGSDFAAIELGDIYSEGLEKPDYLYDGKNGITKNQKEAVKWYLLAEKNGSSRVYEKLGRVYLEGKGVSQNYEEAAKWFHKDSVKGDFDSQYALANMYKEGKGIKKNSYKCYIWVNLAIEGVKNGILKDSPKGEKRLIDFTRTQKFCGKQISAIEKKAGKELAEKYWDKSWNTPGGYLINIEL